jgi:FkbM family methyltransferase
MLTAERYGWHPDIDPTDTRALLVAGLEAAANDPKFGLPAWAREADERLLSSAPLVLFGVSEFSWIFLDAFGPGRVLHIVADDRLDTQLKGVDCISSQQFLETYSGRRDIVCISCPRLDRGLRHFEMLAMRAGTRFMNPEQAYRALKPAGLDPRLADHLPTILANVDRYERLESRLDDELSKETLRRVMLFHMTTCREYYRHIERPYETLYFRSGLFDMSAHEQFVDCGASIGESIMGLLGVTDFRLTRAWLFEPDLFNVVTLKSLLDKLGELPDGLASRISLHECAVGQTRGHAPFLHMGGHGGFVLQVAQPGEGTQDFVPLVRLDDVVDGEPTFIKMDIEGSELGALKGASNLIQRCKPKLAVSAYHRASDLIDLSEYVLSLRPDYNVGLRHHTILRWDTCLYFW